ncbi:MAG: hypothetical protein AAF939_10315 [Planctomycetota bacterium]
MRHILVGILIIWNLGSIFPGVTHAQANRILSPNHANQVVVLANGEILTGRVSEVPDKVIVKTLQGSRIILQADRVEMVCNSLEEAYWEKCAKTWATDHKGQKQIFDWCLKHRLTDLAQNQLNLISELEISAEELASMDRQLNALIRRQTARQAKWKPESPKSPEKKLAKLDSQNPKSQQVTGQTKRTPINGLPIHNSKIKNLVSDLNSTETFDSSTFRPLPALPDFPPPIQTDEILDSNVRPVGFQQEVKTEHDLASNSIGLHHQNDSIDADGNRILPLAVANQPSASIGFSSIPKNHSRPNLIQPIKPQRAIKGKENSKELRSISKEIPDLSKQNQKFIPIDPFDPQIFNRKHHPEIKPQNRKRR